MRTNSPLLVVTEPQRRWSGRRGIRDSALSPVQTCVGGSLQVGLLELLMLGEPRESVAVLGGSRCLRLVFFYCLVDKL